MKSGLRPAFFCLFSAVSRDFGLEQGEAQLPNPSPLGRKWCQASDEGMSRENISDDPGSSTSLVPSSALPGTFFRGQKEE
jgi:hypothetical protein